MKGNFRVAAALAATLMVSAAAPGVSVAAEADAPPPTNVAYVAAVANASPSGDAATKVNGPLQTFLAHFADIEVEENGDLEPCLDLLRGLRFLAAVTGRIDAEMSFTYESDGVLVTRSVTVPLQQFESHPHETTSNPKLYEMVATHIDVGDYPVDRGQTIHGTIRLVLVKGPKRTVMQGDAAVDVHVD